jgi:hypothetical protein
MAYIFVGFSREKSNFGDSGLIGMLDKSFSFIKSNRKVDLRRVII